MKSGNPIQIPLPTEHAYHLGWTSFQHKLSPSDNPYNADDEDELFKAWVSGWTSAERVEKL